MRDDAGPIEGGAEVGVDTGGTFTDFVCRVPGRPERRLKVCSTPADPSQAITEGLERIEREWGVKPATITRFVHGTTVGTNAVLEGKGARIGLLTTEGFKDVLEIGRQVRDPMYAIRLKPATPVFLLPGARRKEAKERIDAEGRVLVPLELESIRRALAELVSDGVESVAVCYLFSFVNPEHEAATAKLLADEFPQLAVSLSSEVDPRFREYERTVTTAFDAYIKPVVSHYLERLESRLREAGVRAKLQLMQSRGGVAAGAIARRRPVRLFLSGPAGGVIGARMEGGRAGERNVITIDIGGTSSDIALIADGAPLLVSEGRIGIWPVRAPMVGVHAIGAGGGSIARVDGAKGLRVGPQSAGSDPGPACYGRGGKDATVTDASLVLGYLDPDYYADGSMRLAAAAAHEAVAERVGKPLGLAAEEAALGIHRVINASMAEGIRQVSIRQGYDPRRFTLVALGGGGAVHATALARELGIARIVIPPAPGVLSAAGLLAAPVEHEVAATFRGALGDISLDAMRAVLDGLDARATDLMASEGVDRDGVEVSYSADLCYIGQSHFLEVALDLNAADPLGRLYADFVAMHERIHGHGSGGPAMVGMVRTTHARHPALVPEAEAPATGPCVPAPKAWRHVVFHDGPVADCPIYDRADFAPGTSLDGPAILEQPDTTTVLEPGWRADSVAGNLLILSQTA